MKVAVGAKTDIGRIREGNQDALLTKPPMFAVADGMGGAAGGDIASSTAVGVINDHADGMTVGGLPDVLREANQAIWRRASEEPSLRGMGTTCTLLMLANQKAHIAHVGDSRAYLFRKGELKQLTEDHTMVARLVKEGRLRPEDAEGHPQRSIITRALGVESDVLIDSLTVDVEEGDRVLLCSDGLSAFVDSGTIAEVLGSIADPQEAADRLVELANQAGGEDNITVIVLHFGWDSGGAGAAREITPAQSSLPPSEGEGGRPGRNRGRVLLTVLVGVAVVAGAAYGLFRYTLANSWFVGVNDEGFVTIYSGIPEEVAGVSFKHTEQETDLSLEELPEFKQSDVADGIKVDSRAEAEDTVDDLNSLATDPDFNPPDSKRRTETNN